jgi:hypothetical protein
VADKPKGSPVNVLGEAAVLRGRPWQYLREQADAGQLKAIENGRAADMPWHHVTEAVRDIPAGRVPEGLAAEGSVCASKMR